MATNTINFLARFSPEGRRACALAGLPAQEWQVFQVALSDVPPAFAEHIYVKPDGSAWLTTERTTAVESFDRDLGRAAMRAIPTRPRGEHAQLDAPIEDAAAYLAALETQVGAWAAEQTAEREREEREREERKHNERVALAQKCAEWASLPVEKRIHLSGGRWELRGVGYGGIHAGTLDQHEPAAIQEARAEAERLNVEADELKKAAAAAKIADRDKWIRAHGSERLRKCVALGMADECDGVYRSERLAHEYPGAFFDSNEIEERDIRNPSLEALNALERMRKVDKEAILMSFREPTEDEYGESVKGPWRVGVRFDVGDWSPRYAWIEVHAEA